jgi:hypothetical protein
MAMVRLSKVPGGVPIIAYAIGMKVENACAGRSGHRRIRNTLPSRS